MLLASEMQSRIGQRSLQAERENRIDKMKQVSCAEERELIKCCRPKAFYGIMVRTFTVLTASMLNSRGCRVWQGIKSAGEWSYLATANRGYVTRNWLQRVCLIGKLG